MGLTKRQKDFAEYYMETGNAVVSAVRAGYSEKYAHANAYKLVTNVGIREILDASVEKMCEDGSVADAKEILQCLTKVLRNGESKPADVLRAAELLGRKLGMWRGMTDKPDKEPTTIIFSGENELED